MFEVSIGGLVFERAASQFGTERGADGSPSEFDFVAGPLADAIKAFEAFDRTLEAAGPAVRYVELVDAIFGAVSFVAVLVAPLRVEIYDFEIDPGYWRMVEADADD